MKNTKQTSELPLFSDVASKIFEGKFDHIPNQVVVDVRALTRNDFIALLELARYQTFGHTLLEPETVLMEHLQKIRTQLNAGKFHEVLEKLNVQPVIGSEEILEKGRAQVFLGHYAEAFQTLLPLVFASSTTTVSRGTAAQMCGHALMEAGEFAESLTYLELALECAQRAGNSLGRLSAHFFLSKVSAFQQNSQQTQFHLNQGLKELMTGIGGFRWVLAYYRHLAHASFLCDQVLCLQQMQLAIVIAKSLGDPLFEAKGHLELMLMRMRFSSEPVDLTLPPVVQAELEKGNDELHRWFEAVSLGHTPVNSSATLKRFRELASVRSLEEGTTISSTNLTWAFDATSGIFIDLKESEIKGVPPAGPFSKLLQLLGESSQPLPLETIFRKVWNVEWNPERHRSLLSVTLSRFNKNWTHLKIERADNSLQLNQIGFVLKSGDNSRTR